ncbi:MAG: biotin transport system substrate-specific component, partial [Lacrimispora sp.]|nr:biotin transport system substrate-specific component [Lacrimispora sp.]
MNQRKTTQEMTVMGLMVALLSASSYIIIPLPFSSASITAQTIVVNLIGLVL